MRGKKAKAARRARASVPLAKARREPLSWSSWRGGGTVAVGLVVLIAASFVLPGLLNKKTTSAEAEQARALGVAQGAGLPAGVAVPSFSERDLLSGKTITSRTVYGRKTLLFFSEGVMCQACFQQIQGLQRIGAELKKRGIQLISITPDAVGELEQAAQQYGITTPLISDSNRSISAAFNTLGRGMHADTPGHAFALLYHGKVLWYRDYWLPPYRTMYVDPRKLLADIPTI